MRVILKFWVISIVGYCTIDPFNAASSKRSFDIILQNGVISVEDKEYSSFAEMTFVMYKAHKALHVEIELKKPVKEFKIRLLVHGPHQKVPLVDITADGCSCLRTDIKHPPVFKIIMNALRAGSKIPDKCPIPANERIIVEHFYLGPEDFPPYFPLMNIFIRLQIYTGNKILYSFDGNYEFKKI